MRHVCIFSQQEDKTTKGALRYQQVQELKQEDNNAEPFESKVDPAGLRDDQGLIGTLYLRKARVHGAATPPKKVTVIVEY